MQPSPSWRASIIWWMWPSWLRRQIVALKTVGSSPIIHPMKKAPLRGAFFMGWMMGLEESDPPAEQLQPGRLVRPPDFGAENYGSSE